MNSRVLNFADSNEAQCFFESHGGEALLKEKYPLVYEAYLRSGGNRLLKGSGDTGNILNAYVTQPTEEGVMQLQASEGGSGSAGAQDYVKVNSKAYVDVKDTVIGVVLSGYMIDAVSSYNYGSFYEDYSRADIINDAYQCVTDCCKSVPKTSVGNLIVKCQIDCVHSDGSMESKQVESPFIRGTKIEDVIASVEIYDPKSKKGNSSIIVGYKGRKGFSPDYSYENISVQGDRVKTMLPISGKITFKPRFKPVGFSQIKTDDIKLTYEGDISLAYGHSLAEIAGYFKAPQGQTVEFKFNDDWNATLPTSKYNGKLKTFLSCPFYYTVQDTEEKDAKGNPIEKRIPFWIGSTEEAGITYYTAKENGNVYVPTITYQWGCFAKDTMILMSDGSCKNVAEIRVGDTVWTKEQASVEVKGIITGTEPEVFVIETEGKHKLKVTEGHPICTERGYVNADCLNITDKIMLQDGTLEGIAFLYTEKYEDQIYSLNLGDSHMLSANGILAGDFACQNREAEHKKVEISEEAKALMDELKRLHAELREREQKA